MGAKTTYGNAATIAMGIMAIGTIGAAACNLRIKPIATFSFCLFAVPAIMSIYAVDWDRPEISPKEKFIAVIMFVLWLAGLFVYASVPELAS